jgi:hypothetical protein
MKGDQTMNRFTVGGLSLAMLLCGSLVLLAADDPPAPAKPDALDPQAMLARIVQLEATVAQLHKALSCMVATDVDYMGSGKSYPVLPPPDLPFGYLNVRWVAQRCP